MSGCVAPKAGAERVKERGRGHYLLHCQGEEFTKEEIMPNKDGAPSLMTGGGW